MAITLEEKREIITNNKDPSIAAINAVLDTYYEILSPITSKDGKVFNLSAVKDDKARDFVVNLKKDIDKFEKVRHNVINDNELTEIDIAYIGVAYMFNSIKIRQQLEAYTKAKDLCDNLSHELLDKIEDNEAQKILDVALSVEKES